VVIFRTELEVDHDDRDLHAGDEQDDQHHCHEPSVSRSLLLE
jgi:hypothetical protein